MQRLGHASSRLNQSFKTSALAGFVGGGAVASNCFDFNSLAFGLVALSLACFGKAANDSVIARGHLLGRFDTVFKNGWLDGQDQWHVKLRMALSENYQYEPIS